MALLLAVPLPQASAITGVANASGYTLSITSLTPRYASANSTIKVSGTLTNRSGQAASGLTVELFTTSSVFSSTSQMQSFGSSPFLPIQAGNGFQIPGTVADGATKRWSATFTSAEAGFSHFGVYGLEAQATSLGGQELAAKTTYLPYWPGSGSSERMKVAWVWPLIDTPRQTACESTLTDDSLDGSFSSTGRLGTLLSTGISTQSSAHLTYAVDPELLNDAQVMSGTYWTGGQGDCTGRQPHTGGSQTARQWLQSMRTGTTTAGMFVTPYADADVSALIHSGLDSDLKTAYTLGESVGEGILHRTFGNTGWPAGGVADASVLQGIGEDGQLNSVILDSSQMPLISGIGDDAVASVTTGVGDTLRVLLADHNISGILQGASTRSAASEFSVEQEYLAQTAMIAAEAPFSTRSIVVTPPRQWDPAASVAGSLLTETTHAPWLESVSLSAVAASKAPSGEIRASVRDRETGSDLGSSYLAKVKRTAASMQLFRSMLAGPAPAYTRRLQAAMAATESATWRGGNAGGGVSALSRLSAFITSDEHEIKISSVPKATLAGNSGRLPVSVFDGTDQAVRVRVVATSAHGRLNVGGDNATLTVPAGHVGTVHLSLSSLQIGTTQIQLQLVTTDGSLLPWTAEKVSVVSTLYGRAVLVLIIVALSVVVLTSATRALRKWLADGRAGDDAEGEPGVEEGRHLTARHEGTGGDR